MLLPSKITLSFLLFFLSGPVQPAVQDTAARGLRPAAAMKETASPVNPTTWISSGYDQLNELYRYHQDPIMDTIALFSSFREHLVAVTVMKNEFYKNEGRLNIRTIYNMKMRMAAILEDVDKWHVLVHGTNELLVKKFIAIERIKSEIRAFREQPDTLFNGNFRDAVSNLSTRQQAGEARILTLLGKSTAIENRIVDITTQMYLFFADITSLLQHKEASLLTRELPLLWKSPPGVYPAGTGSVVRESFIQTMDSLRYYGEMSLWRRVIPRMLLFLLCLVPVAIFNREQRNPGVPAAIIPGALSRYPGTAFLVLGLALSPFIFPNPPHAFMEFIFIGLTLLVTFLTAKRYPGLNRGLLVILVSAFLLLYLVNFFVTPTFPGRLLYAGSILLLIPLYSVYRDAPASGLVHYRTARLFIILFAIHLVAGWGLVVWGTYTLGRSVILSAYGLLVLAMILGIAIDALLGYLGILAWFVNRQGHSVKINAEFVSEKTKPLLVFFAVIFCIIAYLYNINLFDIIRQDLIAFMTATRTIGSTEFTFMSVVLFFAAVYLSFVLASILRNTFEPMSGQAVEKRSNLGSYLLLLRLLVICAGFVIGILASGLPMTNFAILMGALGVGIGFGLQNIISNLVSGLIIAFERPFVVGDVLDFDHEPCRVKEISLRATMVSTSEGADILIPNSTLLSEKLKNWTISNKQVVVELKVMATIGSDPAVVIRILEQCMDGDAGIIRERSSVLLSEINETGLLFLMKILVTDLSSGSKIKSRLLTAIYTGFNKQGIRFQKRNTGMAD